MCTVHAGHTHNLSLIAGEIAKINLRSLLKLFYLWTGNYKKYRNKDKPNRYAQAEKKQRHSEMTIKLNIKLDMENKSDRQTAPTHIAHIAKAPQAHAATKALSKSAIFPTHQRTRTSII